MHENKTTKTNAFGQVIPEIKTILTNGRIEEYVKKTLECVLRHLDVESPEKVVDVSITQAKTYKTVSEYERNVHSLFDEKRITQRIPSKLSKRANLIYAQVKEYLKGHSILDLGCGDGKVGGMIAKEGRQVVLADVYEHGNLTNLELPFVKMEKDKPIKLQDNAFDTTLLLTVLHHANNPTQVIREAVRMTKSNGRIIVIESVYGVSDYGNLTAEEQRLANIFFDHFYNRVIHYSEFQENKVNVPFNFQTPEKWREFFEKNSLAQEKLVKLGFDQPTVPEYHTLHVLKVKK